jgi:hypothetical protein
MATRKKKVYAKNLIEDHFSPVPPPDNRPDCVVTVIVVVSPEEQADDVIDHIENLCNTHLAVIVSQSYVKESEDVAREIAHDLQIEPEKIIRYKPYSW